MPPTLCNPLKKRVYEGGPGPNPRPDCAKSDVRKPSALGASQVLTAPSCRGPVVCVLRPLRAFTHAHVPPHHPRHTHRAQGDGRVHCTHARAHARTHTHTPTAQGDERDRPLDHPLTTRFSRLTRVRARPHTNRVTGGTVMDRIIVLDHFSEKVRLPTIRPPFDLFLTTRFFVVRAHSASHRTNPPHSATPDRITSGLVALHA